MASGTTRNDTHTLALAFVWRRANSCQCDGGALEAEPGAFRVRARAWEPNKDLRLLPHKRTYKYV